MGSAPPALSAGDRQFEYRRLRPGPGRVAADVELHQRARLHRATVELVTAGGYGELTVRRLTKLARVSTASFYEQFAGKDDLFLATYSLITQQMRESLVRTRSPSVGPEEQIDKSIEGLLRYLARDPRSGQFALVEVFAGGPAALSEARSFEHRIDAAFRECLDRRAERAPACVASWLAAGAIGMIRMHTLTGTQQTPRTLETALCRWARSVVQSVVSEVEGPALGDSCETLPGGIDIVEPGPASDDAFLCAAALKLAKRDGYPGLSVAGVGRAAGVSRAVFNRTFRDLEDCFLASLRRLSSFYFAPPSGRCDSGRERLGHTRRWIDSIYRRVAADPATAKLLFADVIEPGLDGLRCREELTTRLAETLQATLPAGDQASRVDCEASAASLWHSISDGLTCGHLDFSPRTRSTYARFALAPLSGGLPDLRADPYKTFAH